jgi:hypothetical protein
VEKRHIAFTARPARTNFTLSIYGSVHFFPITIDFELYNKLGTRAGGEVVQVP